MQNNLTVQDILYAVPVGKWSCFKTLKAVIELQIESLLLYENDTDNAREDERNIFINLFAMQLRNIRELCTYPLEEEPTWFEKREAKRILAVCLLAIFGEIPMNHQVRPIHIPETKTT